MANRKVEALARIYRDGKEITVKLERKPGNALEFYPVPGDSFYLRWSEGFKQKMKLVGRNIDEWFLPFAVKSSYWRAASSSSGNVPPCSVPWKCPWKRSSEIVDATLHGLQGHIGTISESRPQHLPG